MAGQMEQNFQGWFKNFDRDWKNKNKIKLEFS